MSCFYVLCCVSRLCKKKNFKKIKNMSRFQSLTSQAAAAVAAVAALVLRLKSALYLWFCEEHTSTLCSGCSRKQKTWTEF